MPNNQPTQHMHTLRVFFKLILDVANSASEVVKETYDNTVQKGKQILGYGDNENKVTLNSS